MLFGGDSPQTLLLLATATWASCNVGFSLNPDPLLSQYQKKHWQIEDVLPHSYVKRD